MATAASNEATQGSTPAAAESGSVFNLAKWIVIFSFSVIGVLGLAAIIVGARGPEAQRFASAKDVLSLLLPVIGAWAGTVLAYFFSKENFESAARSTSALVRQLTPEQRLQATLASTVMIPIERAVKLVLTEPESAITLKNDIIDDVLDKEDKNRLPILDPQGRPKYMAHRSTIDQFLVQEVAKNKSLTALTLQDMLDDGKYKTVLTNGFGTVHTTSNLAEAKALIDKIPCCLDVYVTEDGTSNTKVLGWLTNVLVMEQAKI
jgi:hypothetical protein